MMTSNIFFRMTASNKALNCLLALCVLAPNPADVLSVAETAKLDGKSASRGLQVLFDMGLAHNSVGGKRRKSGWVLSPNAHFIMPIPLELLSHGFADSAHIGEKLTLDGQPTISTPASANAENRSYAMPQSANSDFRSSRSELGEVPSVISENRSCGPLLINKESNNNLNITLDSLGNTVARDLGDGNDLKLEMRRQLLSVLELGGVYPKLRGELATKLLDDEQGGKHWIATTIGLIAQYRHAHPFVSGRPNSIGGVVYSVLRDRGTCDTAFLPPPEMPFAQQVEWAQNGGRAVAEVEVQDRADLKMLAPMEIALDQNQAEAEGVCGDATQAALEETERASVNLWQSTLAQLKLEVNKSVYDTWIRDTMLTRVDGDVFTITVPHKYARDWLTNRLTGTIKRVVGDIFRRTNVDVLFVINSEYNETLTRLDIQP